MTTAGVQHEIDAIWDEFEGWLQRHQPRQLAALNPPASAEDIELVEAALGQGLPDDLRRSLLRHNGISEHPLRGFYRGFDLRSAARIARTITGNRQLARANDFGDWWKDSYLPFAGSDSGDHCCLDLDGNEVLLWYHDDTDQPALATSYVAWLRDAIEEYREIWDLSRLLPFAGHHSIVEDMDWSSDGSRLLTVGDHCAARLWEADSGRAIADVDDVPSRTFIARFSPDGAQFAVAGSYLRIFDTDRPETVALTLPTGARSRWYSTSIGWFPDGRRIAALTQDALEVWDTGSGSLLGTVALDADGLRGERLMVVSPSGESVMLVTRSALALITLTGHEPSIERIVTTPATRSYGFDADWSPDAQQVAISDRTGFQIFDGQTLELVETVSLEGPGVQASVGSVRWSPDGRHVAAGGKHCRIWAAESGDLIASFEDESVPQPYHFATLAWAPDGGALATGDVSGRLRVWPMDNLGID